MPALSGARLRVCYFNRSYWPDTGATGQLLAELAEDLVSIHGVDVTVVTGHPLTGERPAPPFRNVDLPAAQSTTSPTLRPRYGRRYDCPARTSRSR